MPVPSKRPRAPASATAPDRGGNRQANNALWRIAMVRLSTDERTKAYAQRRKTEGKTPRETLRCIKRYIAREVYKPLTNPPVVPDGNSLRNQRTTHNLTLTDIATALNTTPTPPLPTRTRPQNTTETSPNPDTT